MAVTRGNPDVQALGGIKDGLGGEKVCAFLGSNSFTNNAIQAGSLDCTATAGSGWVIFGKPFTNPPIIVGCVASGVFTDASIGSAVVTIQNIGTGSAFLKTGYSGVYMNWIAFGTY